ncbi:hypothetical protein [Clostridium sp. MD294]|uniref:hypothetical protein n=1 Tax=Clostridium sp. MD294 TaxID=97138 RepID=UPI0002CABD4C|nr:hypothetical protein [Clostridium sp. MD294]NDO47428.1 hypothetical protein [Clostridium sp. MD294]USF29501.1 hypothetical protein C820_000892 [Clostridium sp. MD294]
MERKYCKNFIKNIIFVVIISCVLNVVIWIAFHGIPVVGIPNIEEVESITIKYNNVQQKEIIKKEEIELLVKSSNILNYKILGKKEGQPVISVIYHLKNGKDVMIEANYTTVWWKGKSYEIKEKDMFINIITALFFDLEKE